MKAIFILLGIITFAVLALVYVKISRPEIYSPKPEEVKKPTVKVQNVKKPKVYDFPARVLFVKIDFKNYKNVILYKLVLRINDKFELFNIKALLNNLNLHYSLIETRKITEIFIIFRNLAQAEHTLTLFKEYNFKNIKIEKIKQRI
jgi:hypothetical protein